MICLQEALKGKGCDDVSLRELDWHALLTHRSRHSKTLSQDAHAPRVLGHSRALSQDTKFLSQGTHAPRVLNTQEEGTGALRLWAVDADLHPTPSLSAYQLFDFLTVGQYNPAGGWWWGCKCTQMCVRATAVWVWVLRWAAAVVAVEWVRWW